MVFFLIIKIVVYNILMKTYEHNYMTWGIDLDMYNQKGFWVWGNNEGDFYQSLPENLKIKNEIDTLPVLEPAIPGAPTQDEQDKYDNEVKQFNFRIEKLFVGKVQQVIDGMMRDKGTKINAHIDFSWYLPFTQEELRKAVLHTIQDAILNHWSEISANSSFNTNSLSINNDLTNWIISAQQRNTAGWNALQNSKINRYSWVREGSDIYKYLGNGDTILVGEDFNYTLVDEIEGVLANNLLDGIQKIDGLIGSGIIERIERWDYIRVKDAEFVYRFNGGEFTNESNWLKVGKVVI